MWNRRQLGVALGAPILLLLGSPGASLGQSSIQARDSAGIAILEIPDGLAPGSEAFSLTVEPRLVLGRVGSGVDLYGVTGAMALADGRVAVSENGSDRVLIFGKEGRLLVAHGRAGEGPGEFKRPVIAGILEPDTLLVVDTDLRRLSWVHAGEGFLSSIRIGGELGSPVTPRGTFAHGALVVGGGHSWNFGAGDRATAGYTRPSTSYRSMKLDGSLETDFGEFPGLEMNITVIDLPGGESSMTADLIPFGKRCIAGVGPDRLFIGTNESWEIKAFDPRGRLREIVRLDRELPRVRRSDVEAELQEAIDDAGDPSAAPGIRKEFSQMPIPEHMPAFSSIKVDPRGLLWVGRFRRPGDVQRVYDVVDPQKGLLGQVSLPEGSSLLQAGEDFLLVLHRDLYDVETVRVHPLARSDTPQAGRVKYALSRPGTPSLRTLPGDPPRPSSWPGGISGGEPS